MPIGSILSQPIGNSINAAYRPVILRVGATNTDNTPRPPVVYCDIYFNAVFYKTLSKSQYTLLNIANSEWQFDIQDAAQEYLKKYLGANGESSIEDVLPIIVRTFCRFRSSGYDANGFITTENTAPVQGTSEADPVSGTGTMSDEFYIVNATLQHEDNQDLASHLNSFKRRTWANTTYPITHRPEYYRLCHNDSDVFPILHDGLALTCLVLKYQLKGQSTWNSTTNCTLESCPIPLTVDITVLNNGDDTQTFTFNWSTVVSPSAQLDIQYRIANSTDPWTSNVGSIIPTRAITLPIGLYDFRVAGVGDCNTKPSTEYEDYGVAVCEPVQMISAGNNFPDAQVGIPYNFTIYLAGSAPFALANITKPSWMTLSVVGSTVVASGTPTAPDAGLNVPVEFDITNCSGDESVSVNSTFDVDSAALSSITNNSTVAFAYKIRINGTIYAAGNLGVGLSASFSAPELALGAGYELYVYTSTLLMTTCTAVSNSVNIPMTIDTSGPGTNNQASNNATFAIVGGCQIEVS